MRPADDGVAVGQRGVSEAVWASRLSMVPPSPCSIWMISKESPLMSSGLSAVNSGLKPLNRTVRSSAGVVWSSGMVAPALSGVSGAGALDQGDVALADQVAVADGGLGAVGEPALLVDAERHLRERPVVDLDLLRPDPTRTPAMRTSSPSSSPVTSVNIARYSVVPPKRSCRSSWPADR